MNSDDERARRRGVAARLLSELAGGALADATNYTLEEVEILSGWVAGGEPSPADDLLSAAVESVAVREVLEEGRLT